MSNFREDLKVPDTNENTDMVALIHEYLDTARNMVKEVDKENGIDIEASDYIPDISFMTNRLQLLLDYKEIRAEQAWVSKLCQGDNSRSTREYLSSIDSERREKHNRALVSFINLNDFGKKHNLEPLYKGKVLTTKEIESHDPKVYDIRTNMTNAFLKILSDLGKQSPIIQADSDLLDTRKRIDSLKVRYGIVKDLSHDDSTFGFADEKDRDLVVQ